MTRGVPVQPQTRERVRELAASGMSRNAIARELDISTTTVSRIAKQLGIDFDRSLTAKAVEARKVDLAASRQSLAEKMMTAAHDMLDTINDPYEVYAFGGKDNEFNSHVFDTPPVEVKRNIMTTAGIAFDKATRIIEKTANTDGNNAVDAWLAHITGGGDTADS